MSVPILLTVRQFSEKHPAWSEASLRDLIFKASPRQASRGQMPGNGLNVAIVRQGRKVLLDEAKFFEWLQQGQGVANG